MRSSGDSSAAAVGFLLLCGHAWAQSLSGVETRISTDASDQHAPSISGNIITYTDFRGQDLDERLPAIDGSRVVYEELSSDGERSRR